MLEGDAVHMSKIVNTLIFLDAPIAPLYEVRGLVCGSVRGSVHGLVCWSVRDAFVMIVISVKIIIFRRIYCVFTKG